MSGAISDQTTGFSNLSVDGQVRASTVSSAGTVVAGAVWASQLSVNGVAFPSVQISVTSFNVVAHVVQGSASSFTVATDAAVKKGDILIPNPFGGAGVSSISSGLVWTSHCTQDGQFEFRYSNVSTLVQNQSAQTFALARIRLV
jgi:hypothetical protein